MWNVMKITNKRETEAWDIRTAARVERREGYWMKESEGISQNTYAHDPWTQTTVWRLTKGGGKAEWRWAKGEKVGTTVIG